MTYSYVILLYVITITCIIVFPLFFVSKTESEKYKEIYTCQDGLALKFIRGELYCMIVPTKKEIHE